MSVGQVREPLTVGEINPLPFTNQLEVGDEIISILGYKIESDGKLSALL
jgi:PDZ domain-containing secreted protein